MSVELKKFQERYKKIEQEVEACSEASLAKIKQRVAETERLDGGGLDLLTEAITEAMNEGAKGTTIVDFWKLKGVKPIVEGLVAQADEMEKNVAEIKDLSERAAKVEIPLKALADDIAKDLKDRSKLFSGSRKDIEKLQKVIQTQLSEVAVTKEYYEKKMDRLLKQYRERLMKRMDQTIRPASEYGNDLIKKTKSEALLRDKKAAQNAAFARDLANAVIEACKKAEEAANKGPKAAGPHLKEAQQSFSELVKLDKTYQTLGKENAKELEENPLNKIIIDYIGRINRAHAAADKQLKSTMQAIRELMK